MNRFEKYAHFVDTSVIFPTVIAFAFTVASLIVGKLNIEAWWVINTAIATSILTILWWMVWLGFFIADRVIESRNSAHENAPIDDHFDDSNYTYLFEDEDSYDEDFENEDSYDEDFEDEEDN